jgi:nicotinamidase-related amidase
MGKDHDHLLDAVALVVIDLQEGLLPVMANPEAFTDRVAFSIEASKLFGLEIIFTEQVPEKLGRTLPRLKKLAPKAHVFSKSSFSALQANGIQDTLRDLNIYHLLICGLETGVCIYQTALHAADLELDTTLLSDCLASRRPEDDAFILPALTRNGCHVLPSETVFYSMVADAESPRFHAFSELVKKYHAIRKGEGSTLPKEKKAPEPNEKKKIAGPTLKHPIYSKEEETKVAKKVCTRDRSQRVQRAPVEKKNITKPKAKRAGEARSEKTTARKHKRRRNRKGVRE